MVRLPPVIGHRGLSALAPENTCAAIHAAYSHGISWVEIDLSLLGDDTAVIFHDDTLERCTQHQGHLVDINREDLAWLDAGSWFSHEFAAEPIPTLAEMLSLLSTYHMGLNLELKAQPHVSHATIVRCAYSHIKKYWKSSQPIVISSFDHDILLAYRKADPYALLAILYEDLQPDWQSVAHRIQPLSLHCHYSELTQDSITAIKSKGYQIAAYTCNNLNEAIQLWQSGIDTLFSDQAHLFTQYLNNKAE
ncbi:glycerophosphodiester phosphodiesterase family protein [Neptunomonas phycophila]|uniref:glycerophosphodiester phosphodiesterase family protein n=1 Tax=Neptunomonas phycophila TaxID=1572645 RepID=UPI0030FAAC52